MLKKLYFLVCMLALGGTPALASNCVTLTAADQQQVASLNAQIMAAQAQISMNLPDCGQDPNVQAGLGSMQAEMAWYSGQLGQAAANCKNNPPDITALNAQLTALQSQLTSATAACMSDPTYTASVATQNAAITAQQTLITTDSKNCQANPNVEPTMDQLDTSLAAATSAYNAWLPTCENNPQYGQTIIELNQQLAPLQAQYNAALPACMSAGAVSVATQQAQITTLQNQYNATDCSTGTDPTGCQTQLQQLGTQINSLQQQLIDFSASYASNCQNTPLGQQVASLTQQIDSTASANTANCLSTTQPDWVAITNLQTQISNLASTVVPGSSPPQYNPCAAYIMPDQAQLATLQQQLTQFIAAQTATCNNNQPTLTGQIANLQSQIAAANACLNPSTKQPSELSSLQVQMNSFTAAHMPSSCTDPGSATSQQVVALQNQIASLQSQIATIMAADADPTCDAAAKTPSAPQAYYSAANPGSQSAPATLPQNPLQFKLPTNTQPSPLSIPATINPSSNPKVTNTGEYNVSTPTYPLPAGPTIPTTPLTR